MKAKDLFDKYLSLFFIPFMIFVYGVYLRLLNRGLSDVIGGVFMAFSLLTIAACLLFVFLNRRYFHLKMNWWKNILASAVLFAALYLALVLSARV